MPYLTLSHIYMDLNKIDEAKMPVVLKDSNKVKSILTISRSGTVSPLLNLCIPIYYLTSILYNIITFKSKKNDFQ